MEPVTINPVQEQPKESKLEKFLRVFNVAADLGQVGANIYDIKNKIKSMPVGQ